MSVTLVHPAKAVGQNEMPFGRDIRVVPSIYCVRREHKYSIEMEDLGLEPPVRNDAAYCQIRLIIIIIIISSSSSSSSSSVANQE